MFCKKKKVKTVEPPRRAFQVVETVNIFTQVVNITYKNGKTFTHCLYEHTQESSCHLSRYSESFPTIDVIKLENLRSYLISNINYANAFHTFDYNTNVPLVRNIQDVLELSFEEPELIDSVHTVCWIEEE